MSYYIEQNLSFSCRNVPLKRWSLRTIKHPSKFSLSRAKELARKLLYVCSSLPVLGLSLHPHYARTSHMPIVANKFSEYEIKKSEFKPISACEWRKLKGVSWLLIY
jgi:hypothetical protein